jgi:hypothetical protein
MNGVQNLKLKHALIKLETIIYLPRDAQGNEIFVLQNNTLLYIGSILPIDRCVY